MAWSVGDNKFAFGRREIAIGYVDGDTLLPLRHKPVGKQREIHAVNPSAPRGSLHSGQLVFENGFGIVQQPPNQGTFAIIHAACGNETQQLVLIKLNSIHRSH